VFGFFHQTPSPGPNRHVQDRFRIFSNILDSLEYFALEGSFVNQFRSTPRLFTTGESQLPGDEYTGESRLPGDEFTGESRLPGSEYTGESITNSKNSSNIRKNSKSFLGASNGTRRRCLMKKPRVKKSRDTVPLKPFSGLRIMKLQNNGASLLKKNFYCTELLHTLCVCLRGLRSSVEQVESWKKLSLRPIMLDIKILFTVCIT
jgi:hypothetical protein